MNPLKPGETCPTCGYHEMTEPKLKAEIERLGVKATRVAENVARRANEPVKRIIKMIDERIELLAELKRHPDYDPEFVVCASNALVELVEDIEETWGLSK